MTDIDLTKSADGHRTPRGLEARDYAEAKERVDLTNDEQALRLIPECPVYLVSADGRIWSERSNRFLSPSPSQDTGYLYVTLCYEGKKHRRSVHSCVLVAFIGPRPEGMVSRHLNGVRTDNRLQNLAWGTPWQNTHDAIEQGTFVYNGWPHPSGSAHPQAKLTWDQVDAIRSAYATGTTSHYQLAVQYGVSKSTIGRVVTMKNWKDRDATPVEQLAVLLEAVTGKGGER